MQPTTHLSRACIEHGWSAVNVDDSRRAACGGKARIGQDGHGKRCSETGAFTSRRTLAMEPRHVNQASTSGRSAHSGE